MKKLFAILFFALSFSAQAVDVTLTVTAGELTRLQVAVGAELNLKDTQPTPQPRNATSAEVKAYIIQRTKDFVINYERNKARQTAEQAIVIPAFNPL